MQKLLFGISFLLNPLLSVAAAQEALGSFHAQLTELTKTLRSNQQAAAALQQQLRERKQKIEQASTEEKKKKAAQQESSFDKAFELAGQLQDSLKKQNFARARILLDSIKQLSYASTAELQSVQELIAPSEKELGVAETEALLKFMQPQKRSSETEFRSTRTAFRPYPGFGGDLLLGLPGFGTYGTPYILLTRKALIELKSVPENIAKIFPLSGETQIFAAIWVNQKAQAHYNIIAHPATTAWERPAILETPESNILVADKQGTAHITELGKKLLFCPVKASMGLIPISNVSEVKVTITPAPTRGGRRGQRQQQRPAVQVSNFPFNSVNNNVDVNPHPDGTDADAIRFSPDNAQFLIAADKPIATFWTYLSYKGHTVIMFNIVLNIFNIKAATIHNGQVTLEDYLSQAIQDSAGNVNAFEKALQALSKLFNLDFGNALTILEQYAR